MSWQDRRTLKNNKKAVKNQKKQGDPKKRMESDAEILRQKQQAANERKEKERLEKLAAEKRR